MLTLVIWSRGTIAGGFAQIEELAWIPAIGAAYRLGLDGLSLPLVLLTSLLFFLSAIYSARISDRAPSWVYQHKGTKSPTGFSYALCASEWSGRSCLMRSVGKYL